MDKRILAVLAIILGLISTVLFGSSVIKKESDFSRSFYLKLHTYNRTIGKITFVKGDENELKRNYTNFVILRDNSEALHSETIILLDKIKAQIKAKRPLDGYQLDLMYKVLYAYHKISTKYLSLLDIYSIKDTPVSDYIQLNDEEQTTKNLLALSVYTDLFAMYAQGFDSIFEHTHVRKVVKDIYKKRFIHTDKLEQLRKMVYQVLEKENAKELAGMIRATIDHKKDIQELAKTNGQIKFLAKSFSRNPYIIDIVAGNHKFYKKHSLGDTIGRGISISTNFLSGVFGNLIGAIRWRNGHLHKNKEIHDRLRAKLKPLDMILEKTPYILTDKFIPGNFGHIALWLGTEEQLKEMGMWNHPLIQQYHDKIRAGYNIIEAVRPKVRLNTLEKFLEIDEIAIIRMKDQVTDPIELEGIYSRALSLLGLKYDFNFDVSTTSTVVCSELVFYALGHIQWPVERVLGRTTISPDNVASLLLYENSPVELEYYIKAEKKDLIKELDLTDMAKNVGFEAVEDKSRPSGYSFRKRFSQCRRVKGNGFEERRHKARLAKKGYTVHSRRYSGDKHVNICAQKYVQYQYSN